jgi:LDH2 family malate/lactate/ureidoglycolate dehydrogenase
VSSRDDECVFRADPLRSFCQEVFVACGMAREDAFIVADGLVQSNLRGVGEDCGVEMDDFESRFTGDDLH